MQTNYQKLDWFEAGTVMMIAIGIGLVFLFAFGTLEKHQQEDVASALKMFDIHQQWTKQMESVKFVAAVAIDGPQDFLDEFYLAFIEVASIPSENISQLSAIPETLFVAYNGGGRVLGATLEEIPIIETPPPLMLQLPYYFDKPNLTLPKVESALINIYKYEN